VHVLKKTNTQTFTPSPQSAPHPCPHKPNIIKRENKLTPKSRVRQLQGLPDIFKEFFSKSLSFCFILFFEFVSIFFYSKLVFFKTKKLSALRAKV
jgi:hypothetical protein